MNNGALFKNEKGDNPARPDYRGDIKIDGKLYKLSSWIKKDVKGRSYMSLEATLFEPIITDEDIPF